MRLWRRVPVRVPLLHPWEGVCSHRPESGVSGGTPDLTVLGLGLVDVFLRCLLAGLILGDKFFNSFG